MATTFRLKRKTFGMPTFGLSNLGKALNVGGMGAGLSKGARVMQGVKGTAKLGATAAVGTAVVGTIGAGVAAGNATSDAFEGDGIHG